MLQNATPLVFSGPFAESRRLSPSFPKESVILSSRAKDRLHEFLGKHLRGHRAELATDERIIDMDGKAVTLKLGRDEALVLFELLADFHSQQQLDIPTPAERLALVRLHGALEKVLVEPFRPDYRDLVNSARARLTSQSGES